MSQALETLKDEIVRSRNLAYYGKYNESIAKFGNVIDKLNTQISNITDRTLLTEWNKLLDQMKIQRDMAIGLKETLAGNFDTRQAKKEKMSVREEGSEKDLNKIKQNISEQIGEGRASQKHNFKKMAIHEDDELYNRKQKEMKDKERESERQRQIRQKQFEERQAQIWPKKKPAPKKNTYNNNNKPQNQAPAVANNSAMGDKNRDYGKPWLNGAKKHNAKDVKAEGEERKSFLKFCYPDGNGPDANLIEMLEKEVICFNPDVTFDDIAELEKAKDILEEAVLLPLIMPHIFVGIRKAWKGVLLFGPPGTGKTLLAKAIASGGNTTFFSVTASSLASKWKGQSQKLVRLLFEMAKFYAPTTIFIDQIDSLASKRGEKEDESSRKVKTELMTRIDGVTSQQQGKPIVIIGATNRPWDLDQAIRRRLQKRIYIPLPTEIGRKQMFRIKLKDIQLQDVNIDQIVQKTDGFSGSDIGMLCKEASYMPMRRKLKMVGGGVVQRLRDAQWKKQFQKQVTVPLIMNDFIEALKNIKPSVGKEDLINYEEWMKQFGEQGTK